MSKRGDERTLRGRVAVVGIGETEYYRHGTSPDPEFKLAFKAILAACKDAGLDPREIDGFSSYSDDRSEASRLAAALGHAPVRHDDDAMGRGRRGCCAAVANAAASIVGRAGRLRRGVSLTGAGAVRPLSDRPAASHHLR